VGERERAYRWIEALGCPEYVRSACTCTDRLAPESSHLQQRAIRDECLALAKACICCDATYGGFRATGAGRRIRNYFAGDAPSISEKPN
jgi:hypothetical protein